MLMLTTKKLFYIIVVAGALIIIGAAFYLVGNQRQKQSKPIQTELGQKPLTQSMPSSTNQNSSSTEDKSTKTTISRLDNPFGMRQSDPKGLKMVYEIGARYYGFGVSWGAIETSEDTYNWNQINKDIGEMEAAGLIPYPMIMPTTGANKNNPNGNDWALNCSKATSRGTPQFAKEQCPPKDLTSNWDNKYGYSKTFYNFIYNFVSRYKNRMPKIQIMQEAVNKNFWEAGTSEEAVKIMKTGYKAAHDANSNVVVLNEGGAGGAYAFAVVREKIESGASEQEVMALAQKMLWRTVGNGPALKSYNELKKAIYRPVTNNESAVDKIAYYIDHCDSSCFDVYNFGSKSDPETMPLITQWIKDRMRKAGYSKKIGVNYEMGLHANFPSGTTYTEENFANDMAKLLVTNLAEGVELMLFYGFEDNYTRPGSAGTWGIVKNGQWREATYAYHTVATKISDQYNFDHLIASGSTKRYIFKNKNNNSCDLEVAWDEDGEQKIKIQTSKDTIKSINNYRDENVSYDKGNGWIELNLSASPVFIGWGEDRSCAIK